MMSPDDDQVLSVTQLTQRIRGLLENQIGQVWVQGEISNHRLQSSGHQYFTLKDAGAQLSCVMFRGAAQRSSARLADGQQVQVFGDLSVYEPRGQYQMVVRMAQPKGEGVLQARFEALKRRLHAEGLFDQEHKQPIPKFPAVIALVTSPTGAAIRDMLNVLSRRAPWVRVLVFPVRVQGQGAEHEIARAITALNQANKLGLPTPDTIIVGRGGGSLEDLWNFNEEVVARAIYDSAIPIISAVGHEIDFTIADFAADLRAPTPSAAAELVAPDGAELRRHLEALQRTLQRDVLGVIEHHARVLDLTARGPLVMAPERALERMAQQLDDAESSLQDGLRGVLQARQEQLMRAQLQLARFHPVQVVSAAQSRLQLIAHRLIQAAAQALQRRREALESRSHMLRLLGPDSVLARGYSFTTDSEGRILTNAEQVSAGDELLTHLARGQVRSKVV